MVNKFIYIFLILLFLSACKVELDGCTDSYACNYNPMSDYDDGSCVYPDPGYDCDGSCLDLFDPTNINLPSVPNNFPAPNIQDLFEEEVNLGRHLFYDPILSSDNTVSCASCHKQEYSFADNNPFSFGVNGAIGNRHTPTLINIAFQSSFDWDGKSTSIAEQAVRPIFNELELHNNNWSEVIDRIIMSDLYMDLLCKAYGTNQIDSSHILSALASFQQTLVSSNSRFDQWLNGQVMFTPEEIDGFNIYSTERGDCFHCHPIGLFTDHIFHNNGLDLAPFLDLGRYNVTQNPLDEGSFKSPSLRNIEFSAPYMHDGRFATLEEVIDHYNFGGYDSPTVDPLMKYIGVGLLLTDQEKYNLKAFLLTLSDESFINNPNFSNPF